LRLKLQMNERVEEGRKGNFIQKTFVWMGRACAWYSILIINEVMVRWKYWTMYSHCFLYCHWARTFY
jgi:hypothetical protein